MIKEIHLEHSAPSFIVACKIDEDLCDAIVSDYEDRFDGSNFDELRGYHRLNNGKMDEDLMKHYMRELNRVFGYFRKKYTWSHEQGTEWSMLPPFNIQKYEPGYCYRPLHIEEGGPRKGKLIRNLAFVTYLNDIEEGGETEFPYQNAMIKPEKGLTTIFPAGWTHPHRGYPAPKETKYIITGWSSYHHRC